jgi:hypothetical protein
MVMPRHWLTVGIEDAKAELGAGKEGGDRVDPDG